MAMTKEAREVRDNTIAILENLGMKRVSGVSGTRSLYGREGVRTLVKCSATPSKEGTDFCVYSFGIPQKVYHYFLSEPKSKDYILFLIGYADGMPESLYLVPADFITSERTKRHPDRTSGEYKFHIKVCYGYVITSDDNIKTYGWPGQTYLQEGDKFPQTDIKDKYSVSLDELPEKLFALVGDERAFEEESPLAEDSSDTSTANRILCITYRRLRDTKLGRMVKLLNQFKCQICGDTIEFVSGKRYAEAHHIQPFGEPHDGPDTMNNIICVCPNHHVQLDYGVIRLDKSKLNIELGHVISDEYIDYHNTQIFGKH